MIVSHSSHNVDISKGEITSTESTETLISQPSLSCRRLLLVRRAVHIQVGKDA